MDHCLPERRGATCDALDSTHTIHYGDTQDICLCKNKITLLMLIFYKKRFHLIFNNEISFGVS